MTPWLQDPDFDLYVGDVRDVLAQLPAESVDCCVTSPPYWNLRDYGTGDRQIGLEPTPAAFVAAMVDVFREVHRVLTPQGTLWLNLGDSYNAYNGNRGTTGSTLEGRRQHHVGRPHVPPGSGLTAPGLKSKDLVGMPWRVAFALQEDGWYLRSDIIWSKPNPMPESVTDRPTKAHEYVFLLAKQSRYFFDQEAVKEPATYYGPNGQPKSGPHAEQGMGVRAEEARLIKRRTVREGIDTNGGGQGSGAMSYPAFTRNVRSVWEIPTQPYAEAHFATFPEELPRRCIAGGCPEWVCRKCGKPRERIIDVGYVNPGNRSNNGRRDRDTIDRGTGVRVMAGGKRLEKEVTTTGWTSCECADYRVGVVLDPFMGSGTTALVARRLGRRSIGVELNEEYAELCARRLQQLSLLAEQA